MVLILLTCIALLSVAAVILLSILLIRTGKPSPHDLAPVLDALNRSEAALREEAAKSRQEASLESKESRQELSANLRASMDSIIASLASASEQARQDSAALRQETHALLTGGLKSISDTMSLHTQKASEESQFSRKELGDTLRGFSETMHRQFGTTAESTAKQFEAFNNQILSLTTSNDTRMEAIRLAVDNRLQTIQEENGKKLEEMRQTVDEKLHATLEKRLGESFQTVSTQLENVHKGLGEMKALGAGVGDLKRVLSGVKTRGVLGEVLLGTLLEQVLTPEQFERNACVREGSAERVDFAIRMPGQDDARGHIYLPIDSKFPMEDFQRLQDAYEHADLALIEQLQKQLEKAIKVEGRSINAKYINPPYTTDFAILFLPNENLFAEVIRRPGLQDFLARECRIIVCGPTYLHGLLNSLSMGFRTLAIAKKSSEVWETLGVVKSQFGTFAELLEGVKKKLVQTTGKIEEAASKARTIERKLRNVEALPVPDTGMPEDFGVRALASLPDAETGDQEAA